MILQVDPPKNDGFQVRKLLFHWGPVPGAFTVRSSGGQFSQPKKNPSKCPSKLEKWTLPTDLTNGPNPLSKLLAARAVRYSGFFFGIRYIIPWVNSPFGDFQQNSFSKLTSVGRMGMEGW